MADLEGGVALAPRVCRHRTNTAPERAGRGSEPAPDGERPGAAALPLSVREEARGLLVLSSHVGVPRELVDSLESLAAQVSLAVERASLAEDLHRRQSEARFRSLVAHSSDLITVLDAHGTVTYQSPSVEAVLGYRPDEIEGTEFARLSATPMHRASGRSWQASGESYAGGGSETHVDRVCAQASRRQRGSSSRFSTRTCCKTSTFEASF